MKSNGLDANQYYVSGQNFFPGEKLRQYCSHYGQRVSDWDIREERGVHMKAKLCAMIVVVMMIPETSCPCPDMVRGSPAAREHPMPVLVSADQRSPAADCADAWIRALEAGRA